MAPRGGWRLAPAWRRARRRWRTTPPRWAAVGPGERDGGSWSVFLPVVEQDTGFRCLRPLYAAAAQPDADLRRPLPSARAQHRAAPLLELLAQLAPRLGRVMPARLVGRGRHERRHGGRLALAVHRDHGEEA